jgi:hypothetical protein
MPSSELVAAARVLAIDARAVEAVTAMRAADIPSILLKGRSFAHWLYEP